MSPAIQDRYSVDKDQRDSKQDRERRETPPAPEGFTFSDSLGSWNVAGPRKLTARFLNLNFDVTGPLASSGTTVIDYVQLSVTTFDCSDLNGFLYRRMPLP